MEWIRGTGASPGVGIGPAVVIKNLDIELPDFEDPEGAFADAATEAAADLTRLAEEAGRSGRTEAEGVLGAQSLMARDPMLRTSVSTALSEGTGLQQAIEGAAGEIASTLAASPDEYLAARSSDVLEVADRIMRKIAGVADGGVGDAAEPHVLVAETLSAAETAQLDPARVLGLVLEGGGPTGHVAVIARSLNIPAVVGAKGATTAASTGVLVAMDGRTGDAVADPDPELLDEFGERAERRRRNLELAAEYHGSVVTFGDRPIHVAANVADPEDVDRAIAAKADGIGLYRTEFLFLGRSEPPSEDEQVEVYRHALDSFDAPVTIRTFDIGGDKPVPFISTPSEENPFLGQRGVRLYEPFESVFRTQVRALLRASSAGQLWIMVPMVATVEDMRSARRTIDEITEELSSAGVTIGDVKVGAMLEVPSAVLIGRHLAEHVDFFSIGTNDLTQYTLAADRTSEHLLRYADAAHPAVLQLCREAAVTAEAASVSLSVCGAAAADPVLAAVFVAMGVTRLSVVSPAVDTVKAVVAGLDPAVSEKLVEEALGQHDAGGVRERASAVSGLEPS